MSASYWLEDAAPRLTSPRRRGRFDVVIVGGGVTGCAAAHALARGGASVRLHEAREIASGASGRNGGFALRGGAMPYDRARAELGRERARALWELTECALDRLESLAGDAFRRTGSVRLAADEQEAVDLEAELDALRTDGFAAEWHTARLPGFPAALLHPTDGSLHPARWVRRLAALAAEAGAEIYEHSRVASLDELDADHVLLATDGYTHGLVPELDAAVRPVRGQVLVTEPLPALLFPCPHYARHGYDYWQQTPDLRLVLGGCRDSSVDTEFTSEEATTDAVQDALEQLLLRLLGRLPRITHRWAGIWGATEDGLPLAGSVPVFEGAATRPPKLWVAAGYSGHGNVLGLACGELVADAILGRPAHGLELFEPERALAAAR